VLEAATKRKVLSLVAKLCDPLQLLAPFVIRAKIILQESWIEGLQWDEEFPPLLDKRIRAWVDELPMVATFEIHRLQNRDSDKDIVTYILGCIRLSIRSSVLREERLLLWHHNCSNSYSKSTCSTS
jgi:hypothetical protein